MSFTLSCIIQYCTVADIFWIYRCIDQATAHKFLHRTFMLYIYMLYNKLQADFYIQLILIPWGFRQICVKGNRGAYTILESKDSTKLKVDWLLFVSMMTSLALLQLDIQINYMLFILKLYLIELACYVFECDFIVRYTFYKDIYRDMGCCHMRIVHTNLTGCKPDAMRYLTASSRLKSVWKLGDNLPIIWKRIINVLGYLPIALIENHFI